jgi:hypothetical protein
VTSAPKDISQLMWEEGKERKKKRQGERKEDRMGIASR